MTRVVIGMDPHKRSVTIEVMGADETVLDGGRFATDAAGYTAMLRVARRGPERVWAIEGCSGIGRHVATRLLADGEHVVDVPPKLSARVRVFSTGQGRKTDATSAWSESYICQHFIGVRSFYKTCVRDDVLLRNPAEFVAAPPVHEAGQKRTFLTPLEFAAFLEAARQAGPVEHAAAALMGLSGLRVAEMCSLRVESLSQDAGYDSLKFIGKGGKPADIPLPVPVMRAVRVVVAGRTTGPLLRNRAGNALTALDARRMVNRIAKAAGCRHITPHGLRHTFCTAGLVSGVPMRDMQIAMRHADPRTTGLYDMAKNNKDRHASHRVASFLAGMTG